MMGFNQTLKHFFALLLILFVFLIVSFACPASCNEMLPKNTPSNQPAPAYQVLDIKNTTPFFLNKQEFDKKRKRKMSRRKTSKKHFKARPFSVMLPKGSVPPSGSSPCHNDKPDSSVVLFCGLSAAKP
ncbi:hypothetical protein QQP08_019727 [Theobroma cacao]|nr:hypothetical protein QQP08_019727 [Theobroma cacao]